ncbi:hypothetical protein CLCHR_37930 [Clostridium chromiireducens]|uniref:Uncharacterized protein n=1 Tax=Clostridium chromiireducens TaxID=225345 RepID=A0A1V4IFC0_9CLOT|nr:hypothetical protein CLCHR_37930 [Clostridium chromiireducens]
MIFILAIITDIKSTIEGEKQWMITKEMYH